MYDFYSSRAAFVIAKIPVTFPSGKKDLGSSRTFQMNLKRFSFARMPTRISMLAASYDLHILCVPWHIQCTFPAQLLRKNVMAYLFINAHSYFIQNEENLYRMRDVCDFRFCFAFYSILRIIAPNIQVEFSKTSTEICM